MAKPKKYCILMLITFFSILVMPLLSAPAEPLQEEEKANQLYFDVAVDHSSQWLIRSVAEGEEFNTGQETSKQFELCGGGAENYAIVLKVKFLHVLERSHFRLPKERLYLLNSVLTI